jgi:TolB-like protein/DNA-binding winged helix-turn-helix (wHTH) protein
MTGDDASADDAARVPARQALWVGDWQVAAGMNQIARGEQVVHLEPKAMAVLLHLASHPQEVVGREALLAAVWPGVVVGDNALTQVVIKLRKALGDTAREPTYVQAIAKKGYRLIADVRRGDPPGAGSVAPPASAPVDRRRPARLVAPVFGAILLAIGAVWVTRPLPEPSLQLQQPGRRGEAPRAAAPAVLVEPFEALGAGPGQALIARAITADLVTDLSKVSGLWVVGATRAIGLAAAANIERPRYVLSGTVQQEGDRLRLNVLLTDAETGRQLWSERLDRHARDLFDLQDKLVARILAVLPVKVTEAETMRIAQRSTRNLQAYEKFVHAQAALLVRRSAQNEAARLLYWDAIGLDPAFARAYAGLAMTYALEYQQGWATDGDKALARAAEFARTAIQMRPDMPEAHWVLAFVDVQRRQHDEALHHLDDALRLNPSYADAYALRAGIYTYIGKPAQGVEQLQLALRLNPDAGSLYFLLLGRAYYFLGDIEQARFNLKRTLERNPENLEARIYLAATQWRAGDRDASRWQASEIRNLEPGFSSAAWLANYPLTDPAERGALLAAMTEMGL